MSAVSTPNATTSAPARAWLLASRPATLPAAAVPVIVGAGAALSQTGRILPLVLAVTLASALLIQIGTNFANDYSDFHRGADHEGRLGPLRVTQSGLISHESVRRGIVVAFGAAALLGCYLAWIGGWPIILIGALSILCGLAYTGGPWPFGYHGLGDLFVFLFFGVIAVTGTSFLQTGSWSVFALVASIPVGLLVTNILVINNLRDLPTDLAAGKFTLAVRLGDKRTRLQYALFTIIAYLVPGAMAFRETPGRGWLILPWITAPLAFVLVRQVLAGLSGRDLNPMLKRTGLLLLSFGLLFSAGMILARAR